LQILPWTGRSTLFFLVSRARNPSLAQKRAVIHSE
jgi:hypothetical protein